MQSSGQPNDLILITISDLTVVFCFSGHEQYMYQAHRRSCKWRDKWSRADVAYNFSRVFMSGFWVRLFFYHYANSLQIYRTRWITWRKNKQNDFLCDANVFSHLIGVGRAGNSWCTGGLDVVVSSTVAEVLGGVKRWLTSSAQLSGVSGSRGCCIVATELVYRALNFLRRTCRRKEGSIFRIALLYFFVK